MNDNNNNNDNTNRDDVQERLSLLESQLASLHEQLASQSNKRDNGGKNLVGIELDGDTQNSSLDFQSYSVEDVYRIGEGKDRRAQFRDDVANHVNENARQPRSFRWNNSFFTTRTHADDDYKALSEDTFTMMIMSKPCSKQWWFAFIIFLVQITLLTMILQDQASYDYITTPFDVPYKVSEAVHAGQLLAIMISLATQTDLVIAIITFIMLWSRRRISWTTVAEVAENSHTAIWSLRIAFPLCCKFVEGVLVLLTTFVIVIQSDSMIELFKDFAAMQLISELDNMMFWLALHAYAGTDLMEGAKRAQKIRIKDDVVKSFCGIPFRTIVLVVLFLVMFSGWVYVVIGQVSGVFFYMKFPHCNITEDLIPRMGNQICDGGALNSIGCNFDDNDCLAFNIAYPGCKVVDSYLIGDGHCDPLFNTVDCGFDGGDCCPVLDHERLGDGICDGYVFNTEACNWDNGDCISFNNEFPRCQVKIEWEHTTIELYKEFLRIEDSHFAISDGICQGLSIYGNPECGWEGGDCEQCHEKFQDQIAQEESFLDTFADGNCDGSSVLNIDICSFDGGDCLNCMEENIDNPSFNASLLGDGHCDGGVYMSSACQYDSHDCDSFLSEYPECEAEFPATVGDGTCDIINDYPECDFDGGDCTAYREKQNLTYCFVDDIYRVGDGTCDGGDYRTEDCNFDGGDCDNCTGQILYIGDGYCDGGTYMNSDCGFDGGDCDDCTASNIMMVGDGVCNEDYNYYECYYDGGDCVGVTTDAPSSYYYEYYDDDDERR